MSLNHNRLLLCYKILHNVFPEDMHIARPLIQMLLQRDQIDQAQDLALSTARRMLAIGNAGHAIGFLTICMQLNHPEKEEIKDLGRMAHIASSSSPTHVDHELSRSFALIEQLSDQEGLDFLKQGHFVHAKQGEDIVTQGETSQTFYLILEGEVEVHITVQGGREKNLSTLRPGHFFGEFACVYKLPRSATVTAKGKLLLLEFSDNSIAKLIQHFPLAGDYLMRTVQSRMVHAMTYSSPAFAELPEEDRLWAAEESFLDEYQEGETISLDQSGKSCHILLSGKATLKLPTGADQELKTGSMFGDASPYIQLPSSAQIKAREHTLVCRLPENIFRSFMNVYASFEQHIKQVGNDRSKVFQNH
jgi:CRP-like cAMP-binding protein